MTRTKLHVRSPWQFTRYYEQIRLILSRIMKNFAGYYNMWTVYFFIIYTEQNKICLPQNFLSELEEFMYIYEENTQQNIARYMKGHFRLTKWHRHKRNNVQICFSMRDFTHQVWGFLLYWREFQLHKYRSWCTVSKSNTQDSIELHAVPCNASSTVWNTKVLIMVAGRAQTV
jgi:hypothetical protein